MKVLLKNVGKQLTTEHKRQLKEFLENIDFEIPLGYTIMTDDKSKDDVVDLNGSMKNPSTYIGKEILSCVKTKGDVIISNNRHRIKIECGNKSTSLYFVYDSKEMASLNKDKKDSDAFNKDMKKNKVKTFESFCFENNILLKDDVSIEDAQDVIDALKDKKMYVEVVKVARNNMSRYLRFTIDGKNVSNIISNMTGDPLKNIDGECVFVKGVGMDMAFATLKEVINKIASTFPNIVEDEDISRLANDYKMN